jgi:hypothetical protein
MEIVNQVQRTNDYSKFKNLLGNRNVNMLHLQRLINSMKKEYLFSPILVNEKYEIIDGQHRYNAAKTLKLPINFIIIKDYGLKEVQTLNTNNKNWNKKDYLEAYCDLGNENYIKMKKFMSMFPDFSLSVCEQLITNLTGGINNSSRDKDINGKEAGRKRKFEEGELKIDSLFSGIKRAKEVLKYKPYYDGYNRMVFVKSIISLLKNNNFNNDEKIHKIQLFPSMINHCISESQYKQMLEDVYNYKRRKKVSIRY